MMIEVFFFLSLLVSLSTSIPTAEIRKQDALSASVMERYYNMKVDDLVLVTYVFGPRRYEQASFKIFARSVEGCGVPVMIVGDPPPPPDLELPPNLVHHHITWSDMVERLEMLYNGGKRFKALRGVHNSYDMFHAKQKDKYNTFFKVVDIKPLTPVLFPDQIRSFNFWGYIDNDMWLGDVSKMILPVLRDKNAADFYGITEYVNYWGTHTGPAFGPFTLTRNRDDVTYALLRSRHAIEMIRDVLEKVSPVCFSEWGNPKFGCLGYDHSYSGLASRASVLGLIRVGGSGGVPALGARSMVWDSPSECSPPKTKIDYEAGHFMRISHRDFTTEMSACIPEYMTEQTSSQDYVSCMMKSVEIDIEHNQIFQFERNRLINSIKRLRAVVNNSREVSDVRVPPSTVWKTQTILRNKPCHGKHWKEVLYCHFQYGKNHSAVLNLSSDVADEMLRPKKVILARNFPCGVFAAPEFWWD
jgi:hypothetical protein